MSSDASACIYDLFFRIQSLPKCRVCPADSEASIIKPDIVFFGENLPEEFHEQMAEDKTVCDLLIVIGSSLKVRPVSLIPSKHRSDCTSCVNGEPRARRC